MPRHSYVIVALGTVALAGPAHADALQDRVLAGMRAAVGDRYAFRRTIVAQQTGSDRRTIVEDYDPRRAPAERWTLVSIDGKSPTAKQLASARKRKRGPNEGYAGLAKWFGGAAVRSDPARGQALYRFARLPAGTIKINDRDLSADTQAEVLVDAAAAAPYAARVRFATTRSLRMMLVAVMKSMIVATRYRPLASGEVVPVDVASAVTGSLMGKAGGFDTTITYSDYRAVR